MIRIVEINESYIGGFHAAFDVVSREKQFLARTEAPPIDSFRVAVRENIEKGIPQVLAIDGGEVVGWCQIIPHPRPAESHCGTLEMGLIKSYRGRGAGARLLEECLGRAGKFGLERVELEVFSSNDAAIQLYLKTGFVHEGEKIRAVKIDGAYMNNVLMAKFLNS